MSLEELLNVKVVTASRDTTSIIEAPSVVTVITSEQIKEQGIKSLDEIIKRIPGFYSGYNVPTLLTSNRGIIQDQNINYLILIDGHSQNNATVYGSMNQIAYPFIEHIERVEFIRGPGSTLWGADALMGIINLITKTGNQVDDRTNDYGKFGVTFNTNTREDLKTGSLQYAKNWGENKNLIFTLMATKSDGERSAMRVIDNNHEILDPIINANIFKDNPFYNYPLSYDSYLKWNLNNFSVQARYTRQNTWHGSGAYKGLLREYQQGSVEMIHRKKYSNLLNLESRIFYDYINMNHNDSIRNEYFAVINETGGGIEVVNRMSFQQVKVLSGIKSVYKEIAPSGLVSRFPHLGGTDFTHAIFTELNYNPTKQLNFVLGGRIDHNTLRTKKMVFLPRAAAMFTISERSNIKYMYNTGIERPAMIYNFNGKLYNIFVMDTVYNWGSNIAQTSQTHDLQFTYHQDNVQITAVAFYSILDKLITFINTPVPNSSPVEYIKYANMSPIHTKGIEIAANVRFNKYVDLYGDLGTNDARYMADSIYSNNGNFQINKNASDIMHPDYSVVGTPGIVFNLGTNLRASKNFSLNIHMNGWSEAYVRWYKGQADLKNLGTQAFLDFNILYKSSIINKLHLAIYGHNVTNNKALCPSIINFVSEAYGSVFGLKASYEF